MSESEPTLIQQAEARHQQVRELVERKYPNCRVHDIREEVRTEYKRPYHITESIYGILAMIKDDEPQE